MELTEQEAARAAFAAQSNMQIEQPEITEPLKEEIKEEVKQPVNEVPIEEPKKNEEPYIASGKDKDVAEPAKEPEKVKSFEEYLAEKSGGKFKSYEEIEKEISKPKDEFADDEVKHWNELKKKGHKLDKEFFELQSQEFDKMTDPVSIIQKHMELVDKSYKGLSKKTIEVEIARKYNLADWADKDDKGNWVEKDEEELTDEARADKEKMYRDATINREELVNFKKERTFTIQPDLKLVEAEKEQKRIDQEKFISYLENDVFSKSDKLSTIIDETSKEAFEYKLSDSVRTEVATTMKGMTKSIAAFFKPFEYIDDKGVTQINHQKMFERFAKGLAYDEAVKNALNEGKAIGAKTIIKEDLKNVQFKPTDGAQQHLEPEPKTEVEAIALAAKKKGLKF